jgi:hypothetical protein
MENSKTENLLEIESRLIDWQKSELDKSLAEIENGTIQSENWEIVRDRLFAQHNVK